ncbi:MAG TPA: YqaE/Pmp3 family membrane protein [Chthoniobacteraceae bacterium]|nr:YqaE/Pmp3 family membrane protein [Chthoniobacteraceae bacterium]
MLFFLCVIFPPLAVLLTGRIGSFILSIPLTLLGWFPGVIHAFFVVLDYKNERRFRELARGVKS